MTDDSISRQAAIKNALLIDEFRLVKKDTIDTILRKFLTLRRMPTYSTLPEVEKESQVDGAYGYMDTKSIVDLLEDLPSAQPERKKGWWLIREGISDAQCSECKMYFRDVYDMDNEDEFCRHCGAKMEGLKVVENG